MALSDPSSSCVSMGSAEALWINAAHQASDPVLRCSLLFGDGLSVGVQSDTAGGMPEQLLGDFDIRAARPQ
jgi:hypothetical protein